MSTHQHLADTHAVDPATVTSAADIDALHAQLHTHPAGGRRHRHRQPGDNGATVTRPATGRRARIRR